LAPESWHAASNLLLAAHYWPDPSGVIAADLARQFSDRVPVAPPPRGPAHRSVRLRIGYLTPDFHFHPKAFLHIPHLRYFDRRQFQLFLYSSAAKPDEYTLQAKSAADHWRDVSKRSSPGIASQIRRDKIDVLIDITGHFAYSPLAVFALRPAPLQISIPGYPGSTGLKAISHRLVDPLTDPPGLTDPQFVEQLYRINRTIVCYGPPDAPKVPDLPSRSNGFVMFGSFNNRPKLNPWLLTLWAKLLAAVPGSRLLLHHAFNGERKVTREYRDPIARHFRSLGISSRRLEFIGGVAFEDHLNVIGQADIALDSFPYHGVTTTCECLWMGVPVVTLAGQSHVSRVGVSILNSIGLDRFVAKTPQQYVEIAVRLANNLSSLARCRSGLRERMRNSPLTDSRSYIRAIESAILDLWERSEQ
jgi:protein O-GlcNAc transferase